MKKVLFLITLISSANQCFSICHKDSDCEDGEYCAPIGGYCPGQTPYGSCLPKTCSSVDDCTKGKNTMTGSIECTGKTCRWNTRLLGTHIQCPPKKSSTLDDNEIAKLKKAAEEAKANNELAKQTAITILDQDAQYIK